MHAHGVAHPFLKDLIDCFGRHDVTREQVWELFRHYSESARIIEIKSDEFDDVCYFEDGNPDLICTASSSTRDMRFITAS